MDQKPNTVTIPKRKLILALISIALICSVGSGSLIYVVATSPSGLDVTVSGGPYPGAPSYTIFNVDDTYYAKDSQGVLSESSTNLATVFNSCVQPNSTIIFASGQTFTVTSPLNINQNYTTVTSNGQSTLVCSTAINLFVVTGHHATISNLYLQGSTSTQNAIYQVNAYNNRYENNEIQGFGNCSIYIQAIGTYGNNWIQNNKMNLAQKNSIMLYQTVDDFIINNDLGACGGEGIQLYSSASETITENKIYMAGWNGTDYSSSYGIGIKMDGCNHDLISDNTIRSNALHGLSINVCGNETISGNHISYNDQAIVGDSGIIIADSKFISIYGGNSGNYESGIPIQSYGVRVLTGTSYVTVVGVITNLNTISNISIDNSSSTNFVGSCLNGTTWIP